MQRGCHTGGLFLLFLFYSPLFLLLFFFLSLDLEVLLILGRLHVLGGLPAILLWSSI